VVVEVDDGHPLQIPVIRWRIEFGSPVTRESLHSFGKPPLAFEETRYAVGGNALHNDGGDPHATDVRGSDRIMGDC
jgi:hypothetical protein